jgi:hypothetical protein
VTTQVSASSRTFHKTGKAPDNPVAMSLHDGVGLAKLNRDGSNYSQWETDIELYAGSHDIQGVLTRNTLVPDAIEPTYQACSDSTSSAFPTKAALTAAQERINKENKKLGNAYNADLALLNRILCLVNSPT